MCQSAADNRQCAIVASQQLWLLRLASIRSQSCNLMQVWHDQGWSLARIGTTSGSTSTTSERPDKSNLAPTCLMQTTDDTHMLHAGLHGIHICTTHVYVHVDVHLNTLQCTSAACDRTCPASMCWHKCSCWGYGHATDGPMLGWDID